MTDVTELVEGTEPQPVEPAEVVEPEPVAGPEVRGGMRFMRAVVSQQAAPADDVGAPVWFRASTEGVKRDGLDLKVKDWDLDSWREYPVVLFGHDYMGRNLPIGLGEAKIDGKELHIGVRYDPDDEFAMRVRNKALKGMIAGSVGWEDITRDGDTKHSLMEFSMVPVGADPQALPLRQAAALRSLADALDRLDTDDLHPATVEPDWREVAAAMVAVLTPSGDDTDENRMERYKALLPKYRRLGYTPPEFLDGATLSALGPAERRGLFLADEPDVVPDAFVEPEPEPSVDGDDDTDFRVALASIEARLAALEHSEPTPDVALQAILERLESMT